MVYIIALISLIGLVTLHEFGHFITAKKFGVKVDEFGIGYPPRIVGKKIGETIYSLNWLPFGAFVKMPGETEESNDPASFSKKPVWQRMLIVLAGVIAFWLIAAVLFGVVTTLGAPTAISDDATEGFRDPKVQITAIANSSPAQQAGLIPGDAIIKIQDSNSAVDVAKVKDIQDFVETRKGQEIKLTIDKGKENIEVSMTPRENPPEGEGPLGVALTRTGIVSYPWWQAPWRGIVTTVNFTQAVVMGYAQAITNAFKGVPTGVEVTGPVGIFSLFNQFGQLGANYFIQFVGMIAIYIAIFNILPIPAVDGGKFLFLLIEAVRRKPINVKIEQNITVFFFALLLLLMAFVTIKDIINLF